MTKAVIDLRIRPRIGRRIARSIGAVAARPLMSSGSMFPHTRKSTFGSIVGVVHDTDAGGGTWASL